MLDGEFPMSEFGDLEDLALLFGMLCLLSVLLVLWLVTVAGCAVVIRGAHIHVTGMFAGSASI